MKSIQQLHILHEKSDLLKAWITSPSPRGQNKRLKWVARRAHPTHQLKGQWLRLTVQGYCINICNSFESLISQVPLEEGKALD